MVCRRYLPEFLQANTVHMRVTAFTELVSCGKLAPELAAASLCENGIFGTQLHPGLVVRPWFTVAFETHVAGCHTDDFARVAEQYFSSGKAWKNFHTERLGLLRQPATYIAQAYDIVAMIAKACRQQEIRHCKGAVFAQEQKAIFSDGRVQRRVFCLPIREQ